MGGAAGRGAAGVSERASSVMGVALVQEHVCCSLSLRGQTVKRFTVRVREAERALLSNRRGDRRCCGWGAVLAASLTPTLSRRERGPLGAVLAGAGLCAAGMVRSPRRSLGPLTPALSRRERELGLVLAGRIAR